MIDAIININYSTPLSPSTKLGTFYFQEAASPIRPTDGFYLAHTSLLTVLSCVEF